MNYHKLDHKHRNLHRNLEKMYTYFPEFLTLSSDNHCKHKTKIYSMNNPTVIRFEILIFSDLLLKFMLF